MPGMEQHRGYVRSRAAAEFLGVSIGTLNQWRFHRRYPLPFKKIGGKKRGGMILYRRSDLEKFVEMVGK